MGTGQPGGDESKSDRMDDAERPGDLASALGKTMRAIPGISTL